jgi:putative FmdB family regulatory protein
VPLYEYQCKKCGHRFEKIQKFSDPHVKKCPECGGVVEQMISAPAVQFKGSGWYVTDYPKSSSGSAVGKNGSEGESSAKPAEPTESKAEAKSEKPEKKHDHGKKSHSKK